MAESFSGEWAVIGPGLPQDLAPARVASTVSCQLSSVGGRHLALAQVSNSTAPDALLDLPALILPSIQVNIRAGRLAPVDDNGIAYLRIPLNALPTRR